MSDTYTYIKCSRCIGTGTDDSSRDLNGIPVPASCGVCGGTGYVQGAKIDTTDLMAKIDYIHGKVTAIWNQVKPGN